MSCCCTWSCSWKLPYLQSHQRRMELTRDDSLCLFSKRIICYAFKKSTFIFKNFIRNISCGFWINFPLNLSFQMTTAPRPKSVKNWISLAPNEDICHNVSSQFDIYYTAPLGSQKNRQIIHTSFLMNSHWNNSSPHDYCNEEGVSLHIFQRRCHEPIILLVCRPKNMSKISSLPLGLFLRMFRAPIDRFFCTLGSFLMVVGSLLGETRWCYAGHNKLPKRFHWQGWRRLF